MRIRILFILCCPLFYGLPASAQTNSGNNTSGELVVPTLQTGHGVTLTYTLAEKSRDLLSVSIHPKSVDKHVLSVRVLDKDEKVVMELPDLTGNAAYVQSISLARLPEGSYYIDFVERGATRHEHIAITKTNLTANPNK